MRAIAPEADYGPEQERVKDAAIVAAGGSGENDASSPSTEGLGLTSVRSACMGDGYELAHLNLGFTRESLDHPSMAEFVELMGEVNAAAASSQGFVWTPAGDAFADVAALFGSRAMPNLSVWRTLDELRTFVYGGSHGVALARRHEWFEPASGPAYVLWWVPAGHRPNLVEGRERLRYLEAHGPSPFAFTFGASFDAPSTPEAGH